MITLNFNIYSSSPLPCKVLYAVNKKSTGQFQFNAVKTQGLIQLQFRNVSGLNVIELGCDKMFYFSI